MTLDIRLETPADYHATEMMVRDAFWNQTRPGCDEHWLCHNLRSCPNFVPELSFVAVDGRQVAGAILYAAARVQPPDGPAVPVLTFGPLAVAPARQKQGIGGALVRHSLAQAARLGHRAVLIYGHTGYYPRFGFRPAADFGITTREGNPLDALMALELTPGALAGVQGRLLLDPVYRDATDEELDAFECRFPPRPKC